MISGRSIESGLATALALLVASWVDRPASGEIVVEGVADRSVVADRVSLRIVPVAGATDEVSLNGAQMPAGQPIDVVEPDYYELRVQRTPAGDAPPESRVVQFIVRATARADTEWGLPPWTPPPVVDSSPEELASGSLRLLVPAAVPAVVDIPVVAWLDAPDGHTLRANASLVSEAHAPIRLRRGTGSGFIPAPSAGDGALPFLYVAEIPGHWQTNAVVIERDPPWTRVAGALTGANAWPADARVWVTNDLQITSGASLTIEPGAFVRLAAGATIVVQGALRIGGSPRRPVTFMPAERTRPWGGFILRPDSSLEASFAIFAGSGANASWFDQNGGYDVHRREQALFLVDGGRLDLRDCAAFDGHGQFGHGRNGLLALTRCLVQGFVTGGEYNGGAVEIRDSALIEFPRDDTSFADADNDGIYFTSGHHRIVDSVIGWTKDDALDAGSGGSGSVLASNVWVEAAFHEGFAWSGTGRSVTNLHCVALHCGQGIECGWSGGADSPRVMAVDCLSLGNVSGARFGDNYDWTYSGFLAVTNSLLLFNHRDIFGMNWDDWTWRVSQMDLRGNLVTTATIHHPDNVLWRSAVDGARLAAFKNTPADARVGIALGRTPPVASASGGGGETFVVGLSSFSAHEVRVDLVVETPDRELERRTLSFPAGKTFERVTPRLPDSIDGVARVRLDSPLNALLTGPAEQYVVRMPPAVRAVLVPTGSRWRYFDRGTAPGAGWRSQAFDDTAWKEGRAELGYGDGDEATVIDGGPTDARYATAYFRAWFEVPDPARFSEVEIRLRRDDGGIVHLNDGEAFRSNVPDGPVTSATYTGQNTSSETEYYVRRVPAAFLRSGTNVVAVEIHQANATSSDLSFDLELVGIEPLRLGWARFGNRPILHWTDEAAVLEEALAPDGPWRAASGGSSPSVPEPRPGGGAQFFRLRGAPGP